ncbi:hypothetical protein C6361_24050 [Plantactinospora sp. BC1]|nr:hypothetical protein C6361_24050 [Plantactinospora sp. BC1]
MEVVRPMRPGASLDPTGDPLTFGQEQLRLVEQMSDPETLVYALRLPLRDGVAPEPVLAALTRIVRARDALRMSVLPGEPETQLTYPTRPVQQLPAGADPRVYGAIGPSTTAGRIPCFFAIDEGSDPPRLILHLHHVFVDGWSASLIARDFYRYHAALRAGRPVPSGPPAGSFGAYARASRQAMTGERLASHLAFWAEELRDAEPLRLPYPVRPWQPGLRTGRFPALVFEVDGCTMAGLDARSRPLGGHGSAAILAGFASAVGALTGQRDLLLQTPLTDRGSASRRNLVGSLVNLCVLRMRMPARPDPEATIRSAAGVLRRAMRQQSGPFQRDGRHTESGRVLNLSPKVTIAFNQDIGSRLRLGVVLRSAPADAERDGPCLVWDAESGCIDDLHLEVLASPPDLPLRFKITYRADLWHRDGIRALGTDLAERLLRMSTDAATVGGVRR